MPWRKVLPMDQRRQFVTDAAHYAGSFTKLCAAYGVSRKTGYKWVARAVASGLTGLEERSRRPHTCPSATPPELIAALCEARHRHPTWGPRKLLKILRDRYPRRAWPARSTAADSHRQRGPVCHLRARPPLGALGLVDLCGASCAL